MQDGAVTIPTCRRLAVLILALCGPVAYLAGCNQGTAITIVDRGAPMATIILSADADAVVADAVKDLQLYIKKMSGAELPTSHSPETPGNLILVGRMPAVDELIPDLDTYDLGHDGIVIKSFPNKLVLTGQSDGFALHHQGYLGRSDCGTPNAVYYFLEQLGCRWYTPGEDGEVIPRKQTIEVPPMDVKSKPAFLSRNVGGSSLRQGAMEGEATAKKWLDFVIWQKRNRMSRNRYHQGHTLWGLMNPKKYFESNPEYFSLREGKRQSGYAELCTSNPDVVRIVTENFRDMLTNWPEQGWRSYPVGQNDSWLWCECEKCEALDGDKKFTYESIQASREVGYAPGTYRNIANRYLIFVNEVAERFAESDPECMVTYYALYNLPGFPEVKPRDNVLPVMCHFHPGEHFKKQVREWAKVSKHLFYYGYGGHRIALPKFGIVEDIRWCHEQKGIGITLTANEHSPVGKLTNYLAAKGMWDVHTDAEAVLAAFYRGYYGAAAEPMGRFYQTFEAATRQAASEWDIHATYPDSLTPQIVADCRDYLAQAIRQAEQPVVKRRVESMARYWRATELHVAAQQAMAIWRRYTLFGNPSMTETLTQDARKACKDIVDYANATADEFHLKRRSNIVKQWLKELEAGK